MRDWEIKQLFREKIFAKTKEDDPSSFLVEEMEVCRGDARIDVAVINGRISGYEIKSSLDDLRRLPNQITLYSQVLDLISIVVTEDHLREVQELIPEWWGIITIVEGNQRFVVLREPSENPSIDPLSVASLLWRDEALSILSNHGLDNGIRSKPREVLWKRLTSLPLPELQAEVRTKLRARGANWQSDPPQMSNDVLFQPFSM
jgi:hypothetical protein